MKHIWLYLSKSDIETELRQCQEEGRDLASVHDEFSRVLSLDLEASQHQPAAQSLLDTTISLPLRADFSFDEPSDLEGIRAARPKQRVQLPKFSGSDAQLQDKVHGAWTGRCAGCLLGKPVEGWGRPRMWGYLKALNRWPLADYFRYDIATPEVREKYQLDARGTFADNCPFMPEDDDTNYTTTGLAILQKHGPDFSPADVANFWLSDIPIIHTCTAERVAYRNFCNLIAPPASASFRNPYREWIGAQIRADFWGYACPGNPELAAEFAWRDACISHVKNGIYGEMLCAAMIAASFVTDDIATIIAAGLGEIPKNCRLSEAIARVQEWHKSGATYDEAVEKLHVEWDETNAHDWCHTISNAMVVVIGLLWGENDFATTICRAVQACFDTDCNGATCGSILGIIHGRKNLPEAWAGHLRDTLKTGVSGFHEVKLSNMTRHTLDVIEKVAAK